MESRSSFSVRGSAISGRKIAVVGGGISGLAAAHRLSEILPNADIQLFEASDRLGGVIRSVKQDGYLIEQGADNFLAKPSAGVDLCEKLRSPIKLLTTDEQRRRAFVVRRGQLLPIPAGFFLMSPRSLGPIWTSPALSVAGKLRLLLEPFIPPRMIAKSENGDELPDESVASFARRRLGREVFERLVQPLVGGIYTADPERLSMAATMPQFLEHERTAGSLLRATLQGIKGGEGTSGARYGLFVAPADGMTSLISTLAADIQNLQIHLNTRVTSADFRDGAWRLEITGSSDHTWPFDAVILAVPAYRASAILEPNDGRLSMALSKIEYAGCVVVSVGYRRAQIGHSLDGFGFVVPKAEGRGIIAGSFASQKFPGRAPDEHVLIRVFVGGALQPELATVSDAILIRMVSNELAELLRISGEPSTVNLARWPRSMPQYYVGHRERVRRIERLTAQHATLALAGNAYHGVGIPQCIRSGQLAAERVAGAIAQMPNPIPCTTPSSPGG